MMTLECAKCKDSHFKVGNEGCSTEWRLFEAQWTMLGHEADWGPWAPRAEGKLELDDEDALIGAQKNTCLKRANGNEAQSWN